VKEEGSPDPEELLTVVEDKGGDCGGETCLVLHDPNQFPYVRSKVYGFIVLSL